MPATERAAEARSSERKRGGKRGGTVRAGGGRDDGENRTEEGNGKASPSGRTHSPFSQ